MTDSPGGQDGSAGCSTPLGWLSVHAHAGGIWKVTLGEMGTEMIAGENELARQACRRLKEWLEGGDWPRGLPLAPRGTDFQLRVWQALLEIPPGTRVTYGELARRLGTAPRAVGGACRANPVPLLIPCHRVVAADGYGGFAGHREGRWPEMKRWLLEHE